MDDTAKSVAIGLFALLLLHGSLEDRARRASVREMREAFPVGGEVRARVVAEPPAYLFGNRIQILDLYGNDVSTQQLPFQQYPRSGWKGSIRTLRLHLTNSSLKGLKIDRLEAEIPDVRYDLGWALNRNRLKIRSAGTGTIDIWVSARSITEFTEKKYRQSMQDVSVEVIGDKMLVRATVRMLGARARIEANGVLKPRGGRYVELSDSSVILNGKPVDGSAAARLLSGVNPVLDVDRDFDLGSLMHIETVKIEGSQVHIHGSATVPINAASVNASAGSKAPISINSTESFGNENSGE